MAGVLVTLTRMAAPDRHDYDIKLSDGIELSPGPQWHNLYRWIISQASEFLSFETVYLITDNRDLLADTVNTNPGLSHWPVVAAWWKERIKHVGPYGEHTTVVFVPIASDTGLERVHPTWAGTYILDACVYLFPGTNLRSSTVLVCQLRCTRSKSCGARVAILITQVCRLRQIIHQQARLRRHTRERGLLILERPLSSQAHLQSSPKQEVSRTWLVPP